MVPDAEILGELAPEKLIWAYSHGVFPMIDEGQLLWFSPDPRGVLPLDGRFHVSRSLRGTIARGAFDCTVDKCFGAVMDLCGQGRDEGTWITSEMKVAYGKLHELGFAHSVEAWPAGQVGDGQPAGGLYGVSIGGAFFAESMFHRHTDAGKVALVYLIRRLARRGYVMCDVQWTTDNLRRFGAFDMPRTSYLGMLIRAVTAECRFA
ncbi:MAG: leucyl/phenylalanyl-tRNA--protein transferase [Phycisphaerae bacterium]|jgi:leucyl/phenylalanyl-tRNA--protein transferase|nr:leucyl/phenylalanyl-tRNA--protein transferase [Phycisphaerae bacterium]